VATFRPVVRVFVEVVFLDEGEKAVATAKKGATRATESFMMVVVQMR
jgi:hypothetical protein